VITVGKDDNDIPEKAVSCSGDLNEGAPSSYCLSGDREYAKLGPSVELKLLFAAHAPAVPFRPLDLLGEQLGLLDRVRDADRCSVERGAAFSGEVKVPLCEVAV
jgi:hypothetical protein